MTMGGYQIKKTAISLFISLVLCVSFIVCVPGQPVLAAATNTIVSVSAPSQPISPNSQFTINIDVQPGSAIVGAQFNLSFNPSCLSITGVSEGSLFDQNGANTYFMPGQIDNDTGSITFVADIITTPGQTVSAAGTLAVITMTAGSAKGTSSLSLSNVVVGDVHGQSMSVRTSNSQVSVDSLPLINPLGLQTVNVGSPLTFTVNAADADNDSTGYSAANLPTDVNNDPLIYSASNLPIGARFDSSSRTFSWTPSLGQAGTYNVTISVSDGITTTSANITITVNKPTPVFSNLSSPSINYGSTPTRLGGTIKSGSLIPTGSVSITLNGVTQTALIDVFGNFSSSFTTSNLTTRGSPYPISYVYPGNANFNNISDTSKILTVNNMAASITLGNLSQIYNGKAKSVTYTTRPTGLIVRVTYNGSTTAPTAAGSYIVAATVISAKYSGSATGVLTISKATPIFSNLSSPSITYGTKSTTLRGTIKCGSLIPTGSISITLNGITQMAKIDSSGNFSSSFTTSNLTTRGSPYRISYFYAGDRNFNKISDNTKSLTIKILH